MPTKLDSAQSRYVIKTHTYMVSLPLTTELLVGDPRTPKNIHSHCEEEEDRVKIICPTARKSAVKRGFQVQVRHRM